MSELTRLPARAADGRPLLHKYYRHPGGAQALLVTLPGKLYGVDGALLYYPSLLLGRRGWDTLAITYGFQSAAEDAMPDPQVLAEECLGALRDARSSRPYTRIGLVGKSLGASVAARLCVQAPEVADARAAFLTPLLGTPLFDPDFRRSTQPACLVVGTADGFYDEAALRALAAARPFRLVRLEGGDHSLIVGDDLGASLRALEHALAAVIAFLTD